MSDFNALYAEKCQLQLDVRDLEQQLADAKCAAIQAAARHEEQSAHLRRRIDALIRKVRQQDALLHPAVEYSCDAHGMWSWRCNSGSGCVGWVGHGEHSETAARAAWDEHVQREHTVGVAS